MRALILTFVALILLTALSWFVSDLSLGEAEILVALAIASIKTILVTTFFMHLFEESIGPRLALVSGVFFVGLLATFVAAEVATRGTTALLMPR